MSTLVHCHVGEASVQFPESPVCTSVQNNEDLDQSQDLFLNPEPEEEFEHHLTHRRMATGFMDAKLVNNLGETSDENEEDLESGRRIGNNFPVSLQTVKVLLGIEGNAFKTYVVCPRCIALKHYLTAVL